MRRQIAGATVAAVLGADVSIAGSRDLVVESAWSRASIGTQRPSAAYMTIRNTGTEAVRLIGLRTDLAMMPQVHRTTISKQGVSSMAPAGEVEIGPGAAVALKPGGLHAMLMQLTRPMTKGKSFTLTLVFSDGDEIAVNVPILSLAARGPGS